LQDDRSRRGQVQRLSAGGAERNRRSALAGIDHLLGQALALGAEADRQWRLQFAQLLAAVGEQREARSRGVADRPPRQRLTEHRAHAGPHRLRRERVRAVRPEHHRALDQRVRGADHRAYVGGVADPVQIDANWALDLLQALLPSGDRPRPRAESREARQQLRLDLEATDPRAGGAEQQPRLGAARQSGLEQVLALGEEQPLALAAAGLLKAADEFQFFVVGACDHVVASC